jgi:hypothetical protein
MTLIDFDTHERRLGSLVQGFRQGRPYEHVVIDDFLHLGALESVISAIPTPDPRGRSSDYLFARNKFENPTFDKVGSILSELKGELLSPRFERLVSAIATKPLFLDPHFVGGGVHQGGAGSYLDMHADFNRHPANSSWLRELNILLYLNDSYDEAFGGHLEMQHATTGERGRIAPLNNRLVVMLTKAHTLHGYRAINFPKGVYRTSIAAYAYSLDADVAMEPPRSTLWRPEGGSIIKRAFARISPSLVRLKSRVFGSSTVRRARER